MYAIRSYYGLSCGRFLQQRFPTRQASQYRPGITRPGKDGVQCSKGGLMKKIPIGIMPKRFHDDKRFIDLCDAIP